MSAPADPTVTTAHPMRSLLQPKSLAIGLSSELAMWSPSLNVSASTITGRAVSRDHVPQEPAHARRRALWRRLALASALASASASRARARLRRSGKRAYARERHEPGASEQRRTLAEPLDEKEQRRSADQHPEPIARDLRRVPVAALARLRAPAPRRHRRTRPASRRAPLRSRSARTTSSLPSRAAGSRTLRRRRSAPSGARGSDLERAGADAGNLQLSPRGP